MKPPLLGRTAAAIALEIPAERLRLQGVSAARRAERAYRSFQTLFG
jgi:hypothetical protein